MLSGRQGKHWRVAALYTEFLDRNVSGQNTISNSVINFKLGGPIRKLRPKNHRALIAGQLFAKPRGTTAGPCAAPTLVNPEISNGEPAKQSI
jgi:hypothetical protein